jgi:hypothetical protein
MPQEIVYVERDDTRVQFIAAVVLHIFLVAVNLFFLSMDIYVLVTDPRPILWKVTPFALACYHVGSIALIPFALKHAYRAKKFKLWHLVVLWYSLLFFMCADVFVTVDSGYYLGVLD